MKLKLISYTILLVGLLGCRSESELIETSVSNQKNTINIGGRISSRLVPASEVKRNTLVWDQVLSSMNLVVNKMSTESNQYPLNDILV
jgi:lipoprotein